MDFSLYRETSLLFWLDNGDTIIAYIPHLFEVLLLPLFLCISDILCMSRIMSLLCVTT